MNKLTGVICDSQLNVDCLIIDNHELFNKQQAPSLVNVVDEGSAEKFSRFLITTRDEKTCLNWEINVRKKGNIETMFFSGLFWHGKYFIEVSSERSELFFYPFRPNASNIERLFDDDKEKETTTEKLNEISRLNNELVDIQRELTKKNRQLEELNQRLEILATTDPLTGIYNRRAILERAETELERASREGRIFCMAILDLDSFKQINDTYGHQIGDEALKRFAECLKQSTRKYDAAGRFGGDEFLVYFSLDGENQFIELLGRLVTQIKNISIEVDDNHSLNLRTSVGGVFRRPGDASEVDVEGMIGQADKMLYQAKEDKDNEIKVRAIEK